MIIYTAIALIIFITFTVMHLADGETQVKSFVYSLVSGAFWPITLIAFWMLVLHSIYEDKTERDFE